MNKAISIVLGSIFGAGIGGGLVYWYLNKKYDIVFDKETESYRKTISELTEENADLKKKVVGKLNDAKEHFFNENHIVEVEDPDSIEEDIDEGYDSEPTKKDNSDIRFISMRDYDEDDDYEKEEFSYYMNDGCIVQDKEILDQEEFEEVCGTSVLPLLRKDKSLSRWSSAGDNEIYVRNEKYDTDYKIKRFHSSFDG